MKTQATVLESKSLNDEKLIEEFILDCRLRKFSEESIRSYKSILKITSNFLRRNQSSLLSLDRYVLKKLLKYLTNDRGYSVKTLENYFSVISTFCDYLAYEELIDKNPILPFRKRYIRQYKADRHNTDPSRKLISVEQMRMLINSILDPRNKAIVTLLAKTAFSFLINEKFKGYKIADIGLVSSFEATFASDPSKIHEIQKTIMDAAEEYDVYTLDEKLKLTEPLKEQWIPMSTIYPIGYIASLLLDTGLLIHMNSASTVIAPVKKHVYVSINTHKYTSGEAAWVGALLTPLSRIIGQGLIFGHYCDLSPYGAHTGDIINILFPDKFKRVLKELNAAVDLSYAYSADRFLQLLGQHRNYDGTYNLENQVNLFALLSYHEVLSKIRKMIFRILSFMDFHLSETKFVVSGIGKDLFLKEALNFTRNVEDISKYLNPEVYITLESFGVAAAIAQKKFNVDVIKVMRDEKN